MRAEDIYSNSFFPHYSDVIRKQIREAAYWLSMETSNGKEMMGLIDKIPQEVKKLRSLHPILHIKIALLFLVSENIIEDPLNFSDNDIEKALNFVRQNFNVNY